MLHYYILYSARPSCFVWWTIQVISEWFVALIQSANGCLIKSVTTCSVPTVKEWWRFGFVVKICSKVFEKVFIFSGVIVVDFPLMLKGAILRLKLFIILVIKVTFMLLVASHINASCQVFSIIYPWLPDLFVIRELMRERSAFYAAASEACFFFV